MRLILALILFATPALALNHYVSPTGSDSADGSAAAPWRTLEYAAVNAQCGDTIHVAAGRYVGPVVSGRACTSDRPMRWLGEDGAIIDRANRLGGGAYDNFATLDSSYISVENLASENAPRYGFRAATGRGVEFRRCRARNNGASGFFTAFMIEAVLEGNESTDNGEHGIYVSNSADGPRIVGNVSRGNAAGGIQINADASIQWAGAPTPGATDGIVSGVLIERNWIEGNGVGGGRIARGGGAAINLDGVVDSVVRNNVLVGNHATGIALFRGNGATGPRGVIVEHNTVWQSSEARWALLAWNCAGSVEARGNVLMNDHRWRGAINVEQCPGFVSDYNVMIPRFTRDDMTGATTVEDLAAWRAATGQDMHSLPAERPRDVVEGGGVLRLVVGSPAIDLSPTGPAVDYDGKARPVGAAYDVGAYEWGEPVAASLPDLGAVEVDAGAPDVDAGAVLPVVDMAATADAGDSPAGCSLGGRAPSPSVAWALLVLALAFRRTRK